MRLISYIAIVIGGLSLIIGFISRLALTPVLIAGGIEARVFLIFANTCFLIAIIFILFEMLKSKQ